MSRRSACSCGVSPTPHTCSIAAAELAMYAIGQMPQIRAVMSGASVNCRPRRSASKKRGGSKILNCTSSTSPVADPDEHRALALDAREVVGADLARVAHSCS